VYKKHRAAHRAKVLYLL